MNSTTHPRPHDRAWVEEAIAKLRRDESRQLPTPLQEVALPLDGVRLFLKVEAELPSGSLKHRLARALLLHALCSGKIGPDTHLVEASSGSTAVSLAWFAELLGLNFTAVMPRSVSPEKISLIKTAGGWTHLVDDPARITPIAAELAAGFGGHHVDQFANGERASDWRGGSSLPGELFGQLVEGGHAAPAWIVTGAGTGATATTIGRYVRLHGHPTRLCVADPLEGSAYYRSWAERNPGATTDVASRIEGVGRPRAERSFEPAVVDEMVQVPDAASIATMRWIPGLTGLNVGGSTGTVVWAGLALARRMEAAGERGTIVAIAGDGGERYEHTYGNDAWLAEQGIDLAPSAQTLAGFTSTGTWTELGA